MDSLVLKSLNKVFEGDNAFHLLPARTGLKSKKKKKKIVPTTL
jgi:hypothetical protein